MNVRAARRAGFHHCLRGRLVQLGHGNFSRPQAGRKSAADLLTERQHTGAQRLGQDQGVAGLWFVQRGGGGGIDQARDGKAQFDLVILDAVTADEGNACPLENLHRTGEHKIDNFAGQFFGGKRQHAQGGARLAAHGVDVGKTVGGADLAEEPRVVHARSETSTVCTRQRSSVNR